MKARVKATRIDDYKLQAAKSIGDTLNTWINRKFTRQVFSKIQAYTTKDDSIFQVHEQEDDVDNTDNQKNYSFMNESKQSEKGYNRPILDRASTGFAKNNRKSERDFENERAIIPNKSNIKKPIYAKEDTLNEKTDLNPSDLRAQAQTLYEIDKRAKPDAYSKNKSGSSSNLRIGDIVYFKYVVEVRQKKDGKFPNKMVGILSGDGIASNRLECIDRDINRTKNANFLFKKSLFRVEPSGKYYYQKIYNKLLGQEEKIDGSHLAEYDRKLAYIKKKYEEEKEENDSEFKNLLGQPILYGQTVHLKHLYSDCYLTYQPNSLALQYGCIELTLEEESSEFSNFKFMASGNLKTKEDVVAYSDPVQIVSSRGNYYMHVWDEENQRNSLANGLEVNGSETSSNWKLLRFLDYAEFQEYETNNSFLESGDIVKIKHKTTESALSVISKSLDPIISTKTVILNNELEDSYGSQRISIPTKFLEDKILLPSISFEGSKKSTVSDLWEIQRRNAFIGGFARCNETFRLKNVSTGLFLCQDPVTEKLKLTAGGDREECYFRFRPKKTQDNRFRIEYGDLLKIQTFNGHHLQLNSGKMDSDELCGPKIGDSTNMLFFLEYSPTEISSIANRLSSLFPSLLKFYNFLQDWGLEDKNEVLNYEFTKALESEKDLDLEVDQLKEALENLEDFLKEPTNFSFKVKQRLLMEQKIIEVLVLIIELIDAKVHVNKYEKGHKEEEGKLHRIREVKNDDDWDLLEKTPQYIARKYLENPLKKIYNLLLLSAKNSMEVSTLILKNTSFLNEQLAYYRKEAGAVLKEAIRNSAQFGEEDPHGERIIQWVHLLEMIRDNEGNLPLQILYIEIIAYACVDKKWRGIRKYQNKILKEFFETNSYFLQNFLTFTKIEDEVYVSFGREPETPKEELLESNDVLTASHDIKAVEDGGKYFFSLKELSQTKTAGQELVIDYISAGLMLFHSLCKDRNANGSRKIRELGLQAEILMSCMKNEQLHIKLRRELILIYKDVFIDIDPFPNIKSSSKQCYLWEEIDKKNLVGNTYLWHNVADSSNVNLINEYDHKKVEAVNQFIVDFWMYDGGIGISKLPIGIPLSPKAKFLNDEDYLLKADLILSMLLFTKSAIDLGFTDAAINNQILYAMINLFAVFNPKKGKDKEKEETSAQLKDQNFWISEFVKSNGLSTRHDTFSFIYLEALEIFKLIADLRLNLQIAGSLKVFKLCHDKGEYLKLEHFNQIFSTFFNKYGLKVPFYKDEKSDKSEDETEAKMFKFKSISDPIDEKLRDIIKEMNNPEADETIQGGLVFINMLFEAPETNKFLKKHTREILKSYFDQRESLLEHLKMIELIIGQKEREIYSELDSLEELGHLIQQLEHDDEDINQNHKINIVDYRDRIRAITELIKNLIAQFKDRKKDNKFTLKTQNIMRNLRIHSHILKIFRINYREQEHKELFKFAIKALYHFCKKNPSCQHELFIHVPVLLELVEKNLKPSKLIAETFSNAKNSLECHQLIDKIFQKLAKEEPNLLTFQNEYIIILRTLVVDEKKNGINENQRMVMGRLMINKNFLTILDYKLSEKDRDVKDEELAKMNYQGENLLLLATIALETRIGMIQAKKTLPYDHIKAILIDHTTPFIQKKPFLRCLFQIYMTQWADLNTDFDKKIMIDILTSIVLPDLKMFDRFLEGVIPAPSDDSKSKFMNFSLNNNHQVDKQKKAQDLRDRIRKFRHRLSNYQGKDEKSLNFPSGKKQLPPIANQMDNKRILRDVSEYWQYLNSGKTWNLKQDGLLYFVIDCFHEIEGRDWLIDDNLKEVLSQIRASLTTMSDVLLKIEEEINRDGPTMRLGQYTILIRECIDRLPDKKVMRIGKSVHVQVQSDGKMYSVIKDNNKGLFNAQIEEQVKEDEEDPLDPTNNMLKKIKNFIMKRRMSPEDFKNLFWNIEDRIPREEFRRKLKALLGNVVKIKEIDEFMVNIARSKKEGENQATISLSKVYRKIQKSFERDRTNFNEEKEDNIQNDSENSELLNVYKELDRFIEQYSRFSTSKDSNTELFEVITSLFNRNNKKMTKKRVEALKNLLGKLIKTFHKKHYGLYMLRMLRILLEYYLQTNVQNKSEGHDDSDEEEQSTLLNLDEDEFKTIQLVFAQSEALRICLNNIREGVPKKQILEAVEVLNLMLANGNKHVQVHILEFLKNNLLTSGFFNYIKLQLWFTVDTFKKTGEELETRRLEDGSSVSAQAGDETGIEEIDLQITQQLIKLMRLFCENCFNEFQNFLRSQVSTAKATVVSSNLVNEVSSFLIDLQLADPKIFQNPKMLPLVLASIETLIDFCTGPCQENQVLLAGQRHLISFINSCLDKDINFDSKNENENDLQMMSIFSTIVKFLLALVNGNNNTSIKEFLLNQLNVDFLIRKLVVIYQKKITNRSISIFRQNRRCPQDSSKAHKGCFKNQCTKGFLTPVELVITETVFNLYILLTIFSEEFPDNPKLDKFRDDQLDDEEKARLNFLQTKYNSEKKKKEKLTASSKAMLEQSTTGFNKSAAYSATMISSGKTRISPFYEDLLLNEDDNSEFLSNAGVLGIKDRKKHPPPPKDKQKIQKQEFKVDFVKRIVESETEKFSNLLDKDMQKIEEEEQFKEFFVLKERSIMGKARTFFNTFVNSVEVIRDEQISKNYFQVPFECDYMTENIRNHLIFNANRNSDVERLEYFFFNIPLYHEELLHRQRVSKVPVLEWFIMKWKLFKDIAYISVVANNVVLIATMEASESGELVLRGASPDFSRVMNLIFSVIQVSLSVLVVIFGIIERLPISLYIKPISATQGNKRKFALKKILAIEKNTASLFANIKKFFEDKIDKIFYSDAPASERTFRSTFLKIIKDKENLYNIIYLLISIVAFATTPLVYSILLLDIVKRSEDLQNIIRSITYNVTQLLKTVILGLIVMYFYAIISFAAFRDYFSADEGSSMNMYCDRLLLCWTSTINYGLRSGGGLGDVMEKASIGESNYWYRWIFDLTFFVAVIIILLNIIFGIIIDTFADLRDQRNEELTKIRETCFICGLNKYDFDTRGNGWNEHIYKEHNIYAYLNFCIYILKKDMTECNGIEKYVKELIEKKNVSFIPKGEALAFKN